MLCLCCLRSTKFHKLTISLKLISKKVKESKSAHGNRRIVRQRKEREELNWIGKLKKIRKKLNWKKKMTTENKKNMKEVLETNFCSLGTWCQTCSYWITSSGPRSQYLDHQMYAVDMVDETNDIITTHSHNSRDINKINKHCTASPRDFTDRPKLIHQKNNGVWLTFLWHLTEAQLIHHLSNLLGLHILKHWKFT